jgi:hypothetical protein
MKGDHLYCQHCKQVYLDIDEMYDTRLQKQHYYKNGTLHAVVFKPMCPHCGAWKSLNIEAEIQRLKDFKQDPNKDKIHEQIDSLTRALDRWRQDHGN